MMTQSNQTPRNSVKATEVISVKVKNTKNENLGTIKDFILDKYEGIARYAVLSFGGFLGLNDKLFAVPWKALSYDNKFDSFVLNIDAEKLKSAPGFDKKSWPDIDNREWETSIYSYYNVPPYWE